MAGAEAGPLAGAQATEEAPALVDVRDVTRTFGSGRTAAHALRGVSLTVRRGQLTALCGRSGSGKTTLLNIIGGLDVPTGGSGGVAGPRGVLHRVRDAGGIPGRPHGGSLPGRRQISLKSAAEDAGRAG